MGSRCLVGSSTDAIFWILIFIYAEGGSFRNALETAKKLAREGEKMIFLEEFLGFKEMLSAFFLWLVHYLLEVSIPLLVFYLILYLPISFYLSFSRMN